MPEPSITRAPMVPAVILGWPVETPIGTGHGQRSFGDSSGSSGGFGGFPGLSGLSGFGCAKNLPLTRITTGIPSRKAGMPCTPGVSVKIITAGLLSPL